MSSQKFTNNASTTLGSAASAGDTTMTLAAGTGAEFPVLAGGDYFVATLWAAGSTTGVPNEIVHVSARTGDTVTVVRGQEGTTAQSWNVGDTFALYPTAAWYNNVAGADQIQAQTGNSAVDVGSANAGVIALSPVISTLAAILYSPIRVKKMAAANTGAYTLNVNGLGAKTVRIGGMALAAAQLPANAIFEVAWNGTTFDLISPPAFIPNSQLFAMAANTIKANLTGAPAQPSDVPLSALLTALGLTTFTSTGSVVLEVGGIIIQGFSATVPAVGSASPSFPQAFPNHCVAVVCSPMTGNANQTNGASIGSWGLTSVTITNQLSFSLTPGIIAIGW